MRAVIIGTGPAGITAAATLRQLDPAGSVIALSAEPFPPYSPAALADHFLTGRKQTLFWKGEDVAARLGIDERRDAVVTAVDTDSHDVMLSDGTSIPYEGLIIASGSRLYAPLDGADLPGIMDFKSLRTATELIGRVRRGEARTAIVVGDGLIGIEVTLLLADLGVDVTVIGQESWIMPRVLDPVTAAIAEAELVARGVTLRLGVQADAFLGTASVSGVRLADGTVLTADLVIAATGVKPHTEFLVGSPIRTSRGIQVDNGLRTSVPGIMAAGDVAETQDWLTGEPGVNAIFPNAVMQAPIAAANLLGANRTYDGAESMNSLKHLGVPIVSIGTIDAPDEILRWQSKGTLRSVYLRGSRIIGAQLTGDIRAIGVYRSLMLKRTDVSSFGQHLVEPTFSFGDIAWDALRSVPVAHG
jgi:nitrite reductase (NADH) large subunit